MAEEQKNMKKKTEEKKKPEVKKQEQKTEKPEEQKPKTEEQKTAEKTPEKKQAEKPKQEKKHEAKAPKKDKAIVRAFNLRISKKYSKFVCRAIRGKETSSAIAFLEQVIKKKTPVKMPTLEIAHQKGKGVAGAKYPVKAAKEIKELVKQLEANAHINGIETPIIKIAKADKGETVYRTGFRRAKRTNIYLEAVEKP